MKNTVIFMLFAVTLSVPVFGQKLDAVQAPIPNVIHYSGVVKNASGVTAMGVTFLLYRDEQGGAPLWMETQNVRPDGSGRYIVNLGAASASGLPADLFQSGEARWLAVQPVGQTEQPRILLVAVPYALKAGDAATIGGLPPSAFVLAAPVSAAPSVVTDSASSVTLNAALPPTASSVTTTGGTVSSIPLFTTGTNIQSSALTQVGTGTTTKVAIKAGLSFQATGAATTSAGKTSYPINTTASAFNSSSQIAVGQTFQLKTEPAGNNTANPSASLSVLFGEGAAAPTDTGFRIASNGRISFAPGQTFPGALDLAGTAPGFIGLNPNSSGGGNPLTVAGGSSATGAADAQGGDLILKAGNGTGAGGSGAVHLQTATSAASGAAADILVDRYYIAPNPVPMGLTKLGKGPVALVTLPPNSGGGFILHYTVFANDGTANFVSETGSCVFTSSSNAAGQWTAAGVANVDTVIGLGNPGAFCSFENSSGQQVGAEVDDNLAFTPTTHFAYYQIENISGAVLTLVPSPAKDAVRSGPHTDAAHPSITIRNDRLTLPAIK